MVNDIILTMDLRKSLVRDLLTVVAMFSLLSNFPTRSLVRYLRSNTLLSYLMGHKYILLFF